MQNDLKATFFEMMCPKGGNIQAFLTDLCYKCEELVAMGMHITDKEYKCTILGGISDELVKFASQLLATIVTAKMATRMHDSVSFLIRKENRVCEK